MWSRRSDLSPSCSGMRGVRGALAVGRRGVLAVILLALLAAPVDDARAAGAGAPAASVAVEPDNLTLSVEHANQPARGTVQVTATGIPMAELTMYARPLSLGKNYAFLSFTRSGGQQINLGDPGLNCSTGQNCPIAFEVVGVRATGTYTGTIDVYSTNAKLASVTVNVLLPPSDLGLTLTGDVVKNDVLSLEATQTPSFLITVSSASGMPVRAFRVDGSLAPLRRPSWFDRLVVPKKGCADGMPPAFAMDPPRFVLEGGNSQPILIRVPDCLEPGSYAGFLRISDADDASRSLPKALMLNRSTPERWRRGMLLFWVVIGALLSVALNNAFPLARTRASRSTDLSAADARIAEIALMGAPLRASLRSEWRRLWLLTNAVSFWNSNKNAILTEVAQGVESLNKLIDVAAAISTLRSECESANQPIRTWLDIEYQLHLSEEALMRSDATAAQAPLNAAQQLQNAPIDGATLAKALAADIGKLLSERANGTSSASTSEERPPTIAKRVQQLKDDLPSLSTQSLDDLIAIERDYYIANVWTDDVEFALRRDPDRFNQLKSLFLPQLEAAPAAVHTQLIIALIRSSLSIDDIEEALKAGQVSIVGNGYPRYLDLENYEFVFANSALNNVVAARRLLKYEWWFDDEDPRVDDGDRCKHFFLRPSARKRVGLWCWRAVHGLIGRAQSPQKADSRMAEVRVALPLPGTSPYRFIRELIMRKPRDRASSLTAMQVMTFIITTATAVLAAYGAQYGTTPAEIDWGVCASAVLFGFGIDQVRDRAASSGDS
jgi:hypothetical protein